MNKKSIIVIIAIILLFIGALVFYIYANNKTKNLNKVNNDNTIKEQEVVPIESTFSFKFIDKDKEEFYLDDFNDKPIALLLWRSDADGAIDLIEKYASYIPKYEEKINFIILNTGEKNNDIINLAENADLGVKLYYDLDSMAMIELGINKLPYMMFINKDGHVDQENSLEELDRDLDDYLQANFELLANSY